MKIRRKHNANGLRDTDKCLPIRQTEPEPLGARALKELVFEGLPWRTSVQVEARTTRRLCCSAARPWTDIAPVETLLAGRRRGRWPTSLVKVVALPEKPLWP